MPYDAPEGFLTRANESYGEAPRADIDVKVGSTWYGVGHDQYETGSVDRILEKWGNRGISFAGSMSVTLTNRDQSYSPANTESAFSQLLGKEATVYIFFLTKFPPEPVISETTLISDLLYIGESTTDRIPIFTGRIETVTINSDRSVTIEIRDVLQDVVNSIFESNGRYLGGNVADAIKYLLDLTGVPVNTAAYEKLRRDMAGTNVRFIYVAGENIIEKLQAVHKAFGTSCIVNEDGEVVLTRISPLAGQFALRSYLAATLFSGAKEDEANRNLMALSSNILKSDIINRVVLRFNDWDSFPGTDAEVEEFSLEPTEIIVQDADSIDEWGVLETSISTSVFLPSGSAWIWPNRLVQRYKEPRRVYDVESSLKNGIVAQVADHVDLTDPTVSEDRTGAILTRVGKNPNDAIVSLRIEDFSRESGIKWGFAGAQWTDDGSRPSDRMDSLMNKSFEVAADPGTDDTPLRWAAAFGSGGSFNRSDEEARTGVYSAKWISAGDNRIWRIVAEPLEMEVGKRYTVSVYVKGTVSSGSAKIFIGSTLIQFASFTIPAATYSDWTRFTATGTVTGAGPYYAYVDCNSATFTLYLDDMQIDEQFLLNDDFEIGSLGAVPTNWAETVQVGNFSFRISNVDKYEGSKSALLTTDGAGAQGYATGDNLESNLEPGSHALKGWYRATTLGSGNVAVEVRDGTGGGGGLSGTILGTFNISSTVGSWTQFSIPFDIESDTPQPIHVLIRATTSVVSATIYFDLLSLDDGALGFQENWKRFCYAGKAENDANPGFDATGNVNGQIDEDYLNNFEDLYRAY